MPKRKPLTTSDEDEAHSQQEEELKSKNKRKKADKSDKSLTKRTKQQAKSSSPVSEGHTLGKDKPEIVIHRNDDGEKYLDIGRNRRATVRAFKGLPLLDIREYYGSGTDVKPGKKGISLKVEEWETLKQSADAIDKLFSTIKE